MLGVVLGVGASMARRAQKQARFCELVRAGGGYVRFLGYPAEVDGRILWAGEKRDEGLLNRLIVPWLGADGWGTLNFVLLGPGTNREAALRILTEAAEYPSLQTVALWGQEITPAVVERISFGGDR